LSAWIGEFLDFVRPRAPILEPVDLAELARETLEAVAMDPRVRDQGVELALDVEDGISARLNADPRLLRQVLWNLILNAVQAVSESDVRQITLDLAMEPREGAPALRLRVVDSGPGFGDEDLPRIFEPFFTTRRQGTGLGLATVARIVEDHAGRVEARNLPEGGAELSVLLPVRSVDTPRPEEN
jgi:signal transduction histidine kinase